MRASDDRDPPSQSDEDESEGSGPRSGPPSGPLSEPPSGSPSGLRSTVDRLGEGLESLEALVYVVLTTAILALVGAAFLRPSGVFLLDIALFAAGLPLGAVGIVRGLRWLRRRQQGDYPPREAVTARDVMLNFLALVVGPFFVALFLPEALGWQSSVGRAWAIGLSAVGALVLWMPLWAAYKYVMEP